MKNAGIAGGLVAIGFGLTTIGLSNFQSTPQAVAAVPASAASHGPEEPTIVWYDAQTFFDSIGSRHVIYRAWSDGTVEALPQTLVDNGEENCELDVSGCLGWVTLSSPSEGLNAAADINFDEQVDGADLAFLLSRWGDAPRNPMPPSDCPLGLLNPS